MALEGLLHYLLELDIGGEHHVVPRFWCLHLAGLSVDVPVLADHLAALVELNVPGARCAPEQILKGGLHAVLAHGVVHGIALVLVPVPVLGVDGPHLAQQVGGVLGLILAHGDRVNLHAGELPLLHRGNKRDIHIPGKDIGGAGHVLGTKGQFVEDPHQRPPLGLAHASIHFKVGAQCVHHLTGGGVFGQILQLQRLDQSGQLGGRCRPVGGKGLERPCLRIGKRSLPADAQGVRPGHPLLPADRQQL